MIRRSGRDPREFRMVQLLARLGILTPPITRCALGLFDDIAAGTPAFPTGIVEQR